MAVLARDCACGVRLHGGNRTRGICDRCFTHGPPVVPMAIARARRERAKVRAEARAARGRLKDTPHDRIVGRLLQKPAVFRDRFLENVKRAVLFDDLTAADVTEEDKVAIVDAWREDTEELRVIPDAFKVDPQALTITVYEVEVTHAIDMCKLSKYVELFWMVDEYEWTLDLVVVDRYGNEAPPISAFLVSYAMDSGSEDPVEIMAEARQHEVAL